VLTARPQHWLLLLSSLASVALFTVVTPPVGLAAAVALDAFVLRTVVVPAVMHLCGRANWWLPAWLDRRLPHLTIEPPTEEEQPTHAPGPALV
jgi:RND superfamily putative drug exporter